MGSKLTPRKIDRLMKLANGSSSTRLLNTDFLGKLDERQLESLASYRPFTEEYKSSSELSSGILDLEHCEGFGDSCAASISTTFNPGELTGRSTEAELAAMSLSQPSIDDVIDLGNKQTSDINELISHSIVSSFTGRDLTADEESFIRKDGIVPVVTNKNLIVTKNMDQRDDSVMSMGSYFNNRCMDFASIFGQANSPQMNSRGPNVLEGEISLTAADASKAQFDEDSLDSVPVRQSRTSLHPPPTIPDSPLQIAPQVPPLPRKTFKNPILSDPSKLHLQPVCEESSQEDMSFSISTIETYLNNLKEDRPSNAIRQLKKTTTKNPLTDITRDTNIIKYHEYPDHFISELKDKRSHSGSSTSSANTVINANVKKTNLENISQVKSPFNKKEGRTSSKSERSDWSKSRSNSPCSVQENLVSTSFRLSPNQSSFKTRVSSNKEWVEIKTEPVTGYVGVLIKTVLTVSSLTKKRLSATLDFHNEFNKNELSITLPHFPITLSAKSSTKIPIALKSQIPLESSLQFYLKLHDSLGNIEVEQIGCLEIDFKVPIIQAITSEGTDFVRFAPAQENCVLRKVVILMADSPADLFVNFVLRESNMFAITHMQEIPRNEAKSYLSESYDMDETKALKKSNTKCGKIPVDGALRLVLSFTAPQLTEQMRSQKANVNGLLAIYLADSGTLFKNIELSATVGIVDLIVQAPFNKLHINEGSAVVRLANMGSISGTWMLKFNKDMNQKPNYFQICTNLIKLEPGIAINLKICYIGPEDQFNESILLLEDVATKRVTTIHVTAGTKPELKQKAFPIKTTLSEMCWVREGKKEISLKNYSDKKITVKCKIIGNGFIMETSKAYCTDLLLMFGPNEMRIITVIFQPTSVMPHKGKFIILMDNETEMVKNIRLHACAGGPGASWRGLMTYGCTALLRAEPRKPILMPLKNSALAPAFICVTPRYNLQYRSVAETSSIQGERVIIPPRSSVVVTLLLDWTRIERITRDTATNSVLTLSVLTGAEHTRERILRILRDESGGEVDVSKLPEHLRCLTGTFEGEDPRINESLNDFMETRKSLDILMRGIKELTAQIDLPDDFSDHTIFLAEDTILEHHTLCD